MYIHIDGVFNLKQSLYFLQQKKEIMIILSSVELWYYFY